jgi:hypothetical protein
MNVHNSSEALKQLQKIDKSPDAETRRRNEEHRKNMEKKAENDKGMKKELEKKKRFCAKRANEILKMKNRNIEDIKNAKLSLGDRTKKKNDQVKKAEEEVRGRMRVL